MGVYVLQLLIDVWIMDFVLQLENGYVCFRIAIRLWLIQPIRTRVSLSAQHFASKCKPLLTIRMIVERYMPSFRGLLPFIDHAAQMRMDDDTMDRDLELIQEAKVEMNVDVDEREEIKLAARQTIEAL